ncbi:hypothetical protein BCF74_11535 [Knoellia remsis]|uniref:DUF5709 domain-containing protein n=1 Tax=Knoellia remsis TaxID=407159 RepID=A0A2T0UHU8_9MICO|nr:hypothetical protein [Knoellia remsis]PRY57523.1 hypothetical protein BCF74_11535 [Knoellia remsis]
MSDMNDQNLGDTGSDDNLDFEDLGRDRTIDELEDTDVPASDLDSIDSERDLELTEQELGGLDSDVDRDGEELEEVSLDEEADQADDYLDDSSETDDLPVTPAESRPINAEIAFDSPDGDTEETIDQRINQEEPEAGSAYGKPEDGVDDRREKYGLGDPDDEDVDEPAEEAALHVEE